MNSVKHWSFLFFLLFVASCGGGKKPGTGVEILPFPDRATLGNISPSFGTGGERVTIKGEGFYPLPLQVFFDAEEAVVLVASEEEILLVAPAPSTREPHSATIRIVNADGEEVVFEKAFEYKDFGSVTTTLSPKITSIQPNVGHNNSPVIINGENFVVGYVPDDGQTIVSVGGKIAGIDGKFDSFRITISIPNLDDECRQRECPMDVMIVNPDGRIHKVEGGFIYSRGDTDSDGLTDYDEINNYGTDPTKQDTDNDRLSDYEEVNTYGTDPIKADTDSDGVKDGQEIEYNTDPLDSNDLDWDRDGFSTLNGDCNDRNPGINPDIEDTWDNGVDLNCKPDKYQCDAKTWAGSAYGYYTARISLRFNDYTPYIVSAWNAPSRWCDGTVTNLTTDYQCYWWRLNYGNGWMVDVDDSGVRFKLSVRRIGGHVDTCSVGD